MEVKCFKSIKITDGDSGTGLLKDFICDSARNPAIRDVKSVARLYHTDPHPTIVGCVRSLIGLIVLSVKKSPQHRLCLKSRHLVP